jgi:hypothetical protein
MDIKLSLQSTVCLYSSGLGCISSIEGFRSQMFQVCLPPAPEQKSITKYCSESMSGKSSRNAWMSLAANSAGAIFCKRGSLRVHWAVSMSWQQCLMNDGVLHVSQILYVETGSHKYKDDSIDFKRPGRTIISWLFRCTYIAKSHHSKRCHLDGVACICDNWCIWSKMIMIEYMVVESPTKRWQWS